jgi:hypothetical protein
VVFFCFLFLPSPPFFFFFPHSINTIYEPSATRGRYFLTFLPSITIHVPIFSISTWKHTLPFKKNVIRTVDECNCDDVDVVVAFSPHLTPLSLFDVCCCVLLYLPTNIFLSLSLVDSLTVNFAPSLAIFGSLSAALPRKNDRFERSRTNKASITIYFLSVKKQQQHLVSHSCPLRLLLLLLSQNFPHAIFKSF